ncbi:MAG: hypothetical protein H6568_08710 [Lewinellaceae bacterium]|nr:hypothetical protein [Lewinellaceae bacterium]
MTISAIFMWVGSVLIVTGVTAYFFYRILTNPRPPEVPVDEDAPEGFKTFDVT